jgi:predicted ATP-grasp superfamily ATP-dependent carboligase
MYIESQLEDGAFRNDKEFFFTFLTEQFFAVSRGFRKVLEKRFNKRFEPIYVSSCKFGRNHKLENYLLINSGPNENVEVNLEYEDLNKIFSESEIVQGIIEKLLKKQGRIFIIPFTSKGMKLRSRKVILIGPSPVLAEKLSNKVYQCRLFKTLGLPAKDVECFENFAEMDKALRRREITDPLFASSSCSEGGDGNGIISKAEDLDSFFARLNGLHVFGTEKLRTGQPFAVSKYIDIVSSPNVNAIICGEDEIRILCFSDQIINGSKYLGNIYPAVISSEAKSEIESIMLRLGNYLAKIGFRGIFGCDFIIGKDEKVFIVDLNPRRQTSYLPLLLMAGMDKLLSMELDVALGFRTDKNISCEENGIAWAHRRLSVKAKRFLVKESIRINNERMPFEVDGSEFAEVYFPENKPVKSSLYGYCLVSGKCRKEAMLQLKHRVKEIDRRCIRAMHDHE